MNNPNKRIKLDQIHPKFRNGDTVTFKDEQVDLNNPYSNLFTSRTFVIQNYGWNHEHNQFEYTYKPPIGKTKLLENILMKVYKDN